MGAPLRSAVVAGALLLALPFGLAACGGGSESDPEAEATEGEVARYTVRGEVVQLPDPDNPAAQLQIRHEAIPDFRSGGEVVGMESMTMPFPVAEGVSLEGLSPGDKIEFTFETRYAPDTQLVEGFRIVRVTPLPAETELHFGAPMEGMEGMDGDMSGMEHGGQ